MSACHKNLLYFKVNRAKIELLKEDGDISYTDIEYLIDELGPSVNFMKRIIIFFGKYNCILGILSLQMIKC